MDSLAATILAVIEQAAISGLYRKEQLQIGVQKARKLDLSDDALLGVIKDSTRAYQEKSCAPFYV